MAWAGVFRNPKNQVASAVGIAVGLSGVSATGSAGSVAVATLEGRVAALEKSLDQLREETREFAGRLSGQHDRLTDAFASEGRPERRRINIWRRA